ncbi:MAG: hypothetical protein N2319_09685 [Candidatus Kapabacteria bacterium]|nr:hypothetical protein [Candidatus Kapabacteria bacterium]
MEQKEKKILTYYEVQVLLPDYAFNRLSEEEKISFEDSITSYPDLQQELEDVKKVFRRVEQTDFDGKFARKTRNLSVDVINKVQKKKSAFSFQNLTKYLVPTLGIFIIFLLVWKGDFLFKPKNTSTQVVNNVETKDLIKINQSELSVVLDTLVSENDYMLASGDIISSVANDLSKNSLIENNNLEEVITELYSEEVLGKFLHIIGTDMVKTEIDFYNILNEIDNLELNDLQLIIEELENVKIPS